MNPKQQAALNNVLIAVATFLMTLVKEPQEQKASETPPSPSKPQETPEKAPDKAEDLGDMLDEDDAKAKAKAKKEQAAEDKKKKEQAAAEAKKAEEEKKKATDTKPPEPPTEGNPDQLLADARAAAIAYAGKNGREALRTLLNEFTKGTIAEVDKAKLPDLIKKLRA